MISIKAVNDVAIAAGKIVMEIYQRDFGVYEKEDCSPLTEADLSANDYITDALKKLTPDIPILSEESANEVSGANRSRWSKFWLVDPLDGTKEFIKKNGEFTVNIALIENGEPVFGVVHAPALSVTYWGDINNGAFKIDENGQEKRISTASRLDKSEKCVWRVVGSRSHASVDFESFVKNIPCVELISMGSSLKLCLVAEGKADLYPRLGPTCEWDTAAAHAIVNAAGGKVLEWPSLKPLRYNQKADTLINPFFIVCSEISEIWAKTPILSIQNVYERKSHNSQSDVVWHNTCVSQVMRSRSLKQKPYCIWLTGLSGSGKSTVANALELTLHKDGKHTFLLDGDNVRHGLNKDLGMNDEDRAENIRRVGEVAKLMVDAGLIVITAFISPFRIDREKVRAMFSPGEFIEVFVDTPLAECERRDPKGLYQKAREGKIRDFTGIDSAYECPELPEVHLHADTASPEACVQLILELLR